MPIDPRIRLAAVTIHYGKDLPHCHLADEWLLTRNVEAVDCPECLRCLRASALEDLLSVGLSDVDWSPEELADVKRASEAIAAGEGVARPASYQLGADLADQAEPGEYHLTDEGYVYIGPVPEWVKAIMDRPRDPSRWVRR